MKRLVFCFDGTWNRVDAVYPTNVVFAAESVLPLVSDNTAQLIYYDEGVGTGRWDRIRGGVLGSGLLKNLADAYRFLIFNFTPGDEIYVFGFSRGAYSARSFAGLLSNCGILLRRDAGKVEEVIELYRGHENTPEYKEEMLRYRSEHSPDICLSKEEDEWRAKNIQGYALGQAPIFRVEYIGVWDTVGALGIPASFRWISWVNKKYQFHDTNLSAFVKGARHAIAIDERRKDFKPTLWTNIVELNRDAGANLDAVDAPYQQKWFPGTHSSVGGGGERRGLSDQALDWVLDGARKLGLALDPGRYSRIYEFLPNHTEFLESSAKPGLLYSMMTHLSVQDRLPGPSELFEVSQSARRRWHEKPENLRDQTKYRPPTLAGVAAALDTIDPKSLGLGGSDGVVQGAFKMYQIQPNDTLMKIAHREYGDAQAYRRIYEANLDKLESADRIYAGQLLRIPLAPQP